MALLSMSTWAWHLLLVFVFAESVGGTSTPYYSRFWPRSGEIKLLRVQDILVNCIYAILHWMVFFFAGEESVDLSEEAIISPLTYVPR
jgi:hypothetical protein